MNPAEDEWIIMGIKQMEIFEKDNEAYMNLLVNGTTLLEIWGYIYAKAVALKVLMPIEQVSEDYKRQLWREAYDISKGRLERGDMMRICKALLTMKNYAGLN